MHESDHGDVLVCACNVVLKGGKYLLVRESKASAHGRYNLPAGKLEAGETLVEAAGRECREETGLVVRVERLIGVYHCPRTSEGFAVVNFVFASAPIGGAARSSSLHPDVAWFSRAEIAGLGRDRMLRGMHIERSIDAFEDGVEQPSSLVEVVPPSPLPIPGR